MPQEQSLPHPPQTPHPHRTLWMGDVPSHWDLTSVQQLWTDLGLHVDVKFIPPRHGLARHHAAHSGYCFLQFETPDQATDALAYNGTSMKGTDKVFRLNWASAATLETPAQKTPEYSLFVGDLSPATTEAHLLALFQTHFSSIKTVRVMSDPASGSSRCFGFVRFTDEHERQAALVEMNGKWLGGRQIRVALATPKHRQRDVFIPPVPMGGFYPFQPFDPNTTTVFVGGLSQGVNEDTLATLFEPFGSILSIKVPPGKGCGFVRFTERKDAEAAIQGMQGFAIAGGRIRLSWGHSNGRRRPPNMEYDTPNSSVGSGMMDVLQMHGMPGVPGMPGMPAVQGVPGVPGMMHQMYLPYFMEKEME
ncbi:Ngr1 protein [Martiniozyma asiatica (nom. inval.)]|nr:Ngr1 protein [Martiniozyma asiatica]